MADAESTRTNTSNPSALSINLNGLLIASLLLVALYYISTFGIITSVLALVVLALAGMIYKRLRLGYFSCAAACFGAFWLARTGQDFIGDKTVVMSVSLPLLVLALYLHEKLTDKKVNSGERANV